MSAFSEAYPNTHVTGCYFHLTQSVIRKVNELGLKVPYETNDEVRGNIRCLSALAFVPVTDVVQCFETLAEAMPPIEHMDELLSYFEQTYVRGRRLQGRGETTVLHASPSQHGIKETLQLKDWQELQIR